MVSNKAFSSLLLLPALLRATLAQNSTLSSSAACNNSPSLCNRAYNEVTYLGAHDSPFLRDASTFYSTSGNQFYDTTTQLSAGVRLLTAQIQLSNRNKLHVCHTDCTLLDAGPLSGWLSEVRSWMDSNPNEVVTIILVNGAQASPSDLAAQYTTAGLSSLAYTPTGSTAETQDWPTLQSLVEGGTRILTFVDSLSDNTDAPYLMHEYDYIFENQYQVDSLSGFSCEAFLPSKDTQQALSNGRLGLMNHFLDQDGGFGIQTPAIGNITTTNAPGNGIGMLGSSATQCKQEWSRAPSYVLVDFFNVGPAIKTVDRLNGVSTPVGRKSVSTAILQSGASAVVSHSWCIWTAGLAFSLAIALT